MKTNLSLLKDKLKSKGFIVAADKGWTEFAVSFKDPNYVGMHFAAIPSTLKPSLVDFGVFVSLMPGKAEPFERKMIAEGLTEEQVLETIEQLVEQGYQFANSVRSKALV